MTAGSQGVAHKSPASLGQANCMSTRDVAQDARAELVDFLVHRAFYPVLMVQRTGPDKAVIERVQGATYRNIERFRGYGSADDVIANFTHDLESELATGLYVDLRRLDLPVGGDLRKDFELKARQLGFMA